MKKLSKFLVTTGIAISVGWVCLGQGFYRNFTWNNHSGKDFITDAKDQIIQGPCHCFAAAALTESMYALLYYFPGNTFNFSEYQLYSACTKGGTYSPLLYSFMVRDGIVDEENNPGFWYPNPPHLNFCALDSFSACCVNPSGLYRYKVSWNEVYLDNFTTKNIQDFIYINGPLHITIRDTSLQYIHPDDPIYPGGGDGGHSMVLHGWQTISNSLYWVFKDSWPGEPEDEYLVNASIDLPQKSRMNTCRAYRITSVNKEQKIQGAWTAVVTPRGCTGDADCDGYCFWGVGPKLCNHGVSNLQDFNDNDPTVGPLLSTGYTMTVNPLTCPYLIAPVGQTTIYGPLQTGNCSATHTLNSSYWKNITGDQLDWVPYTGSTPTLYTGPDNSAPGGLGLYIYLEATGGCYNQTGMVESKYSFYIPNDSYNYSLKYYYHMYGSTMGTLRVKLKPGPNQAWVERGISKSGNKGNSWFNEVISLNEFKGKSVTIRFEGTTGYGEYSDMAIQNITVQCTNCGTKSTNESINDPAIESATDEPLFNLYPNPTENQLYISTLELLDYHLSIYNTAGKMVYAKKLNSSQIIDVGTLPKGLYIVKIKYNEKGKKVFTEEIIIK